MISEKKRIGKLDKTEEKAGTHHCNDIALHLTSKCRAQFGRRQEAEYSLYREKRLLSFASSCVSSHFMGLPIMANQLKSQIIF